MAQKRITLLDKFIPASTEPGYGLNFVLIYEDSETRKWARDIFDRVAKLGGDDNTRATWWRLNELSIPVVLAGAVSTALRADVIVVATRATEGLPLPFYLWTKAWLPHRAKGPGALIALLPREMRKAPKTGRVKEFLRGTAELGRLDFLVEHRELPAESATEDLQNGLLNGNAKINGANGHTRNGRASKSVLPRTGQVNMWRR